MSVAQVHSALPQLSTENLTGAVRYFDGMTNDARLVLDSLRSAAAAGAALINYAPVERAHRHEEHWRCELTDAPPEASQPFDVSARCVVNASGAWADRFPASGVKLRLTKGVHLVIDRERLNISHAVVMSEGARILFAIPWGERVILGTTDTDYDGPIDSPTCEPSDLRYILDVANANFPTVNLTADDVISTWAGLRPLIGGGDNERGRPSDISRAHQIRMTQPGWFDVAGGKLTTYRLMAEQTIDQVVDYTGVKANPCATAVTPLLSSSPSPLQGEGRGEGRTVQTPSASVRMQDDTQTRATGSPNASTLTPTLSLQERGNQKYSGILPPQVTRDAVDHFVRSEWAVHVCDVMIRRTSWRYYHRDHAAVAQQVAGWMSEILGWSDERREEELALYDRTVSSAAACGVANRFASPPPQLNAEQVQPA
jgi:glycerol-3-phosphate dehydrogenase